MKKIQINGAARLAIRNQPMHGREFHETAEQVGPDVWVVALEDFTVEQLDKFRELWRLDSYSDVLLRLASFRTGPN